MNVKNTNNLNIKTQLGGVIPVNHTSSELIFLNTFGSKGFSNDQFDYPIGMALDYDGNLVVADTNNNRLQVFSYSEGKYLRTIKLKGSDQFVSPYSVVFDHDNIIVADYGNHRIQIIRYNDGSHIRTIKTIGGWAPTSVAVDGKGNVLVYDLSGKISVFRISDGSYLRSICKKGSKPGQLSGSGSIIFDKEGNIVVADSDNHRLQVISYSDGTHLRTIGNVGSGDGQFQEPSSVAFDGEGNIVVADTRNNRIQILRYSDGNHLKTIGQRGKENGEFISPTYVVIDSRGCIIVCDYLNNRIQIFDAPYKTIKQKSIISNEAKIIKNIHKSFVYSTVYNNNYTKFISTSGDSTLIIWNIEHTNTKITNITIEKILTGHQDRVVCVAWKSDSKECASGSNDCSVIIWNTVDGSIIKKYDDHNEIIRSVDYNNIGTLASGSDDKTIIVYNKEKTILHHKNRVRSIKWNPDNENLLLSGCDDFLITLWNVSNKSIIKIFKEHTNFIYSLVWNNETTFASSSSDETIKIWNTDKIESIKVLTCHVGNIWSIDWKENVLVSGGNDKKILKWETTNYTNQELTGHTGYVLAVNIDKNNNIISGGTDNIIHVW